MSINTVNNNNTRDGMIHMDDIQLQDYQNLSNVSATQMTEMELNKGVNQDKAF